MSHIFVGGALKLKNKAFKPNTKPLKKKKKKKVNQTVIEDEEVPMKTNAEIEFEKALFKREIVLNKPRISKTHRERIDEFNLKLSNDSDIHDIPKVGPG